MRGSRSIIGKRDTDEKILSAAGDQEKNRHCLLGADEIPLDKA